MSTRGCSDVQAMSDRSARRPSGRPLVAQWFDSGFPFSHHSFNSLGVASDGRVYYVLSTAAIDVAGQLFRYDPATHEIEHLGDLNEAAGEKGLRAIPQGKCHVPLYECDGQLYFATHVGYYALQGLRQVIGTPPPGYQPYPGGHFLRYHLRTGRLEDIAKVDPGQGILAMAVDCSRRRLYGLTWPDGFFVSYDLERRWLKNLGPVSLRGEAGSGTDYRTLCRALVLDPDEGCVYLTTAEGDILRYRCEADRLERVAGDNLRKDYFGHWDPTTPGHMGYNWRQAVWHPVEKVIYAVHGNSGYLFRFDPREERVEVLERIASRPSRRSGMYDKFYYGYLGFTLGPDLRTLYYLTGGCIYHGGRPLTARDPTRIEAQGEENVHLVTWDIPTETYHDHGPIFFEDGSRPAYVNSIAIGTDGAVYALAEIAHGGRKWTDLIRIPDPFEPPSLRGTNRASAHSGDATHPSAAS